MNQQEDIRRAVALKAAVRLACSFSEPEKENVLDLASVFLDWLKDEKITLPFPTSAQKKVLDAINAELNLSEDVLYTNVLDWAEQYAKKRIYPSRQESVQKFIDYYRRK